MVQANPMGGGPMMFGLGYPYNSPHMYDQFGRMKTGLVTWDPDPSEGPYRPFNVGGRTKRGGYRIDMVQACTEQEFVQEIKSTKRKLSCYVFCCCFICALKGLIKMKEVERKHHTGEGVEARNWLLKAKINAFNSMLCGAIMWSIFMGAWALLMLPFVWIPYVIIALCF